MDAIQVFWTKPSDRVANNTYGFKSLNHLYMSALYSLQCIQKQGYSVKLVTDDYGKKLLTEYFKIPYNKVDVSLNDLHTTPYLWGLSKFYAFSLERKPFLYVDLDFFMHRNIPKENLNADIFCQNVEIDYLCYYYGYMGFDKYISQPDKIYQHFVSLLRNNFIGKSYNTAVFGGKNVDLIHSAAKSMFDFVEKNYLNELTVYDKSERDVLTILSIFIEQVYLYYYVQLNNPSAVVKPLIKGDLKINFSEFQTWNKDYNHLISHLKREPNAVLNRLIDLSGKNGFVDIEESTLGLGYENLFRVSRIEY